MAVGHVCEHARVPRINRTDDEVEVEWIVFNRIDDIIGIDFPGLIQFALEFGDQLVTGARVALGKGKNWADDNRATKLFSQGLQCSSFTHGEGRHPDLALLSAPFKVQPTAKTEDLIDEVTWYTVDRVV